MNHDLLLPRPWRLALLLWATTVVAGTILVFAVLASLAWADDLLEAAFIALLCGLYTTLYSWPAVPFAVAFFRRTFALPSLGERLAATVATITGIWTVACVLIGAFEGDLARIFTVGYSYHLTALFTALLIYRRWLFRPSDVKTQAAQ